MDHRRTLSLWADGLRQSLSFMFRAECVLCSRPAGQVFCQGCSHRLKACQRTSLAAIQQADLPPLYSWGYYQGSLKQSLARLKYDRCHRVAEPLGQWLAQLWLDSDYGPEKLIAVPIPLHKDRQQQRGYNQADLIARSFCHTTGMVLQSQGLIRTQSTAAQFGLSRPERYRNLSNAFCLGESLQRQSRQSAIVLIDDIFTTGATLKSATQVLHQCGFRVATLLTVALSERHPS